MKQMEIVIYLLLGMMSFLIYRKGLMDGIHYKSGIELKPIVARHKEKQKNDEITEQEKRRKQLMANVEQYNGTSNGQKKI